MFVNFILMKKRTFIRKGLLILVGLLLIQSIFSQMPDIRVIQAKDFLKDMEGHNYAQAVQQFDSVVLSKMPAPVLEQVWETLQKQVGPYQKFEKYSTENYKQYFIVYLTCRFKHALLDMKLVYAVNQKIAGLFFLPARHFAYPLPSYADTTKFHREPVEVKTGKYVLHGELTTPVSMQIYPVVVLVHGSGPNDQDETIGPNKVFRDLAYGLSSNGVAVLRYDKRTYEYGREMNPDQLTVWDETIDDAISAVHVAEAIPGADGVFLLGHSLGGYLAPRIAEKLPHIGGVIIMAGNTRPLEDLILEQMTYIFSLDGMSSDDSMQLNILREEIRHVKDSTLTPDYPRTKLPLQLNASYWLDLRKYDPVKTAEKINKPLLILQGKRDYQVTLEDFEGWKNGLADKKEVTFKLYPDLNHLFMKGTGKSKPEEYMQEGHVSEEVTRDIAEWIKEVEEAMKR